MDFDAAFDTVTRAEAGVEIELKLIGSGKPSGAFITVIGSDSVRFGQLSTERARKMREAREKGGELTVEAVRASLVDLITGCTLGWRGIERGGQPITFSVAAARDLYSKYPAVLDQINEAVGDRANFLPA